MPAAVRKLAISFGMVYIPISLYTAVQEKGIGFHQITRGRHAPAALQGFPQRRLNPAPLQMCIRDSLYLYAQEHRLPARCLIKFSLPVNDGKAQSIDKVSEERGFNQK